MGGKLPGDRPRRRDQRSDQLRLDRNGNRLSAHGRQLQGGFHHRRARRFVRPAESLRAKSHDADRDRSRHLRRAGAALYGPAHGTAAVGAAGSRFAARHRVHPLHLRHNRPRQRRSPHGARDVVGHGSLLGADHRPVQPRHRALPAAVVSFLRAQFVGVEHPGDRRQRIHHGKILDQRRGAAAQDRRIHLLPRRADHVPLSVASDAR